MIPPVEILGIATGGEGVARLPDGKVCFVPRTAPGDVVHIEMTKSSRRFSRALPIEIASPGPERVEPPCPYYEGQQCGACQLQHLSRREQLRAKSRIVGDTMRRIGRFDVADPPVAESPSQWGYRRRVRMRGTLAGGRVGIGFRSYVDPDRVSPQSDCLLATQPVRAAIAALASCEELPTDLGEVLIRETESGVDVVLETDRSTDELASLGLSGEVASLSARRRKGIEKVFGTGDERPLVFEQANPELADRIRLDACDSLGVVDGLSVADLFCGVGRTSAILRDRGASVVGVDVDARAVGIAKTEVEGVRFVASPVEEALADIGEPDVLVVNPPRTGLPDAFRKWAGDWASVAGRKLAYVSCDPPTLARDLSAIGMAKMGAFRAYDLFPQTSHVEVLVTMES